MGNCFPNICKDNKVGPAPLAKTKKDIHEILSEGTNFKRPSLSTREPLDMTKALKGEGADLPVKKLNVAFTVKLEDDKGTAKIPSHIVKRLEREKNKDNEVEYTMEEELLMAEIVRDDIMKEKKEKLQHEDVKVYDAKCRRMCIEYCKEKEMEMEVGRATPDVAKRRKRVKDMADEARRRAATERMAREGK